MYATAVLCFLMKISASYLLIVVLLYSCAEMPGDDKALLEADWQEIEKKAEGSDLYWYMWGGSTIINTYVKEYIGARLKEKYDISLHVIPVADTALAVAQVEISTAADTQGKIDMLWINGENFRRLREQDLLFGPYAGKLPNMQYVDVSDPSIASDFGYPVDNYESPYGAAQFALIYDQAQVGSPPHNMTTLLTWIEQNPGKFTYPAIPDFVGSAFVRHIFYHVAKDALTRPFDEEQFTIMAPQVWDILNRIEPHLWRGGDSYPETSAQLELLYANGEVYFDLTYHPNDAGVYVDQGRYPPSSKAYVLDSGTISNVHFVAIPHNAVHKAAAMVAANLILDPEMQWEKSRVWGDFPAIDVSRLPNMWQQRFAALEKHPSNVDPVDLGSLRLSEPDAKWLDAIEKAWVEEVLTK